MKTYAVKTRFSFRGQFFVKSESEAEARDFVADGCGLVMGGGIHTNLSADEIDWEFPTHPTKTLLCIREVKEEKRHERNQQKTKNISRKQRGF